MSDTDSRLIEAKNRLASLEQRLQQEPSDSLTQAVVHAMIQLGYAYDAVGNSRAENQTYQTLIERFSQVESNEVKGHVLTAYLYKAINLAHRIVHDGQEALEFYPLALNYAAETEHKDSQVTLYKLQCYYAGLLADLNREQEAMQLYVQLIPQVEQADKVNSDIAAEARLHLGCLKFSLEQWQESKQEFEALIAIYDSRKLDARSATARHIKRARDYLAVLEQLADLNMNWSKLNTALASAATESLANFAYLHLHALFMMNNHRRIERYSEQYLSAITADRNSMTDLKHNWVAMVELLLEHFTCLSDDNGLINLAKHYQDTASQIGFDFKHQRTMLLKFASSSIGVGQLQPAIDIYRDFIDQNDQFQDQQSHQYTVRAMFNLGVALGDSGQYPQALEIYSNLLGRYQGCESSEIAEYIYHTKKNSFHFANSAYAKECLVLEQKLNEIGSEDESLISAWVSAVRQAFDWGMYDKAIDIAVTACCHFGVKGFDSDYYAADDYDFDDEDDWLDEWEEGLDEQGVVRPNQRAQAIAAQAPIVREALAQIKLILVESVKCWNDPSVTSSCCDSILLDALRSLADIHNPQQSDILFSCYLDGFAEALDYTDREGFCTEQYLDQAKSLIDQANWQGKFAGKMARLALLWAKINYEADDEDRFAQINLVIEQYKQTQNSVLEPYALEALISGSYFRDEYEAINALTQCWQDYLVKEPSIEVQRLLAKLCIKQVELAEEMDDEASIVRWANNYVGHFADTNLFGYSGLEEMQTALEDLE